MNDESNLIKSDERIAISGDKRGGGRRSDLKGLQEKKKKKEMRSYVSFLLEARSLLSFWYSSKEILFSSMPRKTGRLRNNSLACSKIRRIFMLLN